MAPSTLANSPRPESKVYDGQLIERLTETVDQVLEIPAEVPTDEERRQRNAEMLNALWILGEQWGEQAVELSRPKPDPLTIALNGFPDVNTYYAHCAGEER